MIWQHSDNRMSAAAVQLPSSTANTDLLQDSNSAHLVSKWRTLNIPLSRFGTSEATLASKRPRRSNLTTDLTSKTQTTTFMCIASSCHFYGFRGHGGLHTASVVTSELNSKWSVTSVPLSVSGHQKLFDSPRRRRRIALIDLRRYGHNLDWKLVILHVLSSDNDSGSQAEAESQRAGVHGGRRQDVAQGGKHPEAATGEKYIIEVRLILISLGFFYFC